MTVPDQRDVSVAQLLDAMPDAAAVLDRSGTIVAVNRVWRAFGQDNGGTAERTGVGVSYLDVCRRSAATGCADAVEVEVGLRDVLQGRSLEAVLDYPCPSPVVDRWFALRASLIDGGSGGVLVAHTNITRQKVLELDLTRQASLDSLTGLSNRAQLDERLTSALIPRVGREPHADVGVLYLDLDRFKLVNDTYGHAAGDEVLQTVASRLRGVLRPRDTIARMGGDEFCVLVTRTAAEQLTAMVGRVERALATPHRVHGVTVTVSASVGWCMAMPGESPAQVLQRADESMYVAKRHGDEGVRRLVP